MLILRPLFSSHNLHREGGRKTHLSHNGASLCGISERPGSNLSHWDAGDEICGAAELLAWIGSDLDGELCQRCAKAGAALAQRYLGEQKGSSRP